MPKLLLIDGPDLDASVKALQRVIEDVLNCDLFVCLVVAGAGYAVEHRAIAALRTAFADAANRRLPPLVIGVTGIETVSQTDAAAGIVGTVASALAVPRDDVVAVGRRLPGTFDIDELWARIEARLTDAHRAKFVRQMEHRQPGWRWRKLWSQAVGAGRIAGRTLWR